MPGATLDKLNFSQFGGAAAIPSDRSLRLGFGNQVDDCGVLLRKIGKYRSSGIRA